MADDYSASALAGSAIGAMVATLIFLLLAASFNWWGEWWVYFIIAMSWIGFVTNIIKFFALYGKKCPQCKRNISSDSRFCQSCGYQFYKECPKCNKVLNPGARYCDNCGNSIES